MNFIKQLWKRLRAECTRSIPYGYFKGYRRLATTRSEIVGEHCYNCKHAVAFISWHCDRREFGCKWEACYVEDEISWVDYKAGLKFIGGWLGLPDIIATDGEGKE